MSDALERALSVFDDAALEALANKGIVRRALKDVEAGKVRVVERSADSATVEADGETVAIKVAGPKAAACTCPAKDVCRHRVAAVVALRPASRASAPSVAVPGSVSPDASTSAAPPRPVAAVVIDPLAEVLAIQPAMLRTFAGKANLRNALDLLAAGANVTHAVEGPALAITIGTDSVRFLCGLGLDGMLSKGPAAKRKALHAAAILAVQRANGLDPVFDDLAPPASEPHDLGADTAFHAAIARALEDGFATALASAPLVLEDRLFELSVSSRAARLPRLAGLLRQLSADVAARRERDVDLDPLALLLRLARAFALNDAISHATAAGRDRLAGALRQDYEPQPPMTLHGLGAETWTVTTARGVTGYFFAVEAGRVVTVSLARSGGHDPSFDPARALATEPIWGVAPLVDLQFAQVALEGGALAPDGRVSLATSARALILGATAVTSDDARAWPMSTDDWSTFEMQLRRRFAAGLRDGPRVSVHVLVPAAHGAARFDVHTQSYRWPLADRAGGWIEATLAHDPTDEMIGHRLQRLSRIAAVTRVVAVCTVAGDRFVVRPAIVFAATPSEPTVRPYVLQRSARGLEQPSRDMLDAWLDELRERQHGAPPISAAFSALSHGAAMAPTLTRLVDDIRAIAELGARALEPRQLAQLRATAARLDRHGVRTLADAVGMLASTSPPLPSAALRALHLSDRHIEAQRILPWLTPAQVEAR